MILKKNIDSKLSFLNSELKDKNDESKILQTFQHDNICKIIDCWNERPPHKWQMRKDRELFGLP